MDKLKEEGREGDNVQRSKTIVSPSLIHNLHFSSNEDNAGREGKDLSQNPRLGGVE